ncbi:glycosyltransferase family 2 protein [Solirubrobacter ginsenosidimutans]|uniref:Glycosyltransferase family 2 protein n=1 Tax=Solirubrobacter ginsenosidimutans TaxID=490573 RepID=A0A9X3MRS9_9ACTN|nr:glycosyltransferase family 2 protein [Solirubrobacter ginsenosidimutans]MDA0160010.1 glycosyltransferase family 2 protein [Solirubrobacter ginsenosidimutans]
MKPLVVIPNYMSHEADMEILGECVQSIRRTVSDTVDVLIIDDCSPAPWLVDVFEERYERAGFELVRSETNEGFSRTVNVGLQRALAEGREAILMNADIVMLTPGWLNRCRRAASSPTLVGARLLYPNGLIQHAGLYFSLIANVFEHRFRYAPGNLPEANVQTVCPVTGAFQYIPAEVLQRVGPYDPEFRMGYEDVDYCLRVFQAGFRCLYEPAITAIHHESLFRSRPDEKLQRWHDQSLEILRRKWAHLPVAELAGGL